MVHTQEGIQPMWEDARNRAGGRWLVGLDRRDRKDSLDNCWMETVRYLKQWYTVLLLRF